MLVKQISVFLENKKGRLAKLTRVLGETGIDLIALSIADTTDYGILRCIVSDTDKALQVIKQAGMTASVTEAVSYTHLDVYKRQPPDRARPMPLFEV